MPEAAPVIKTTRPAKEEGKCAMQVCGIKAYWDLFTIK